MATGPKQFIAFHLIGILIFLCLPVLFLNDGPSHQSISSILANPWLWVFCIIYIGIFYLNAYWLFPNLYLKKQQLVYFAAILVLIAAVYFIKPFDHIIRQLPPPNTMPASSNMPPPQKREVDFVGLFLFFVIAGLSMLIPIVRQWQKVQQQYLVVQKDKATAELSFLKAQINPHFLFNTLNNLYSLALTNSDKTPESILRLSNIMRYVTDEVYNDFVLLENEIQCMADFIELQKLRLNSKTSVTFTYTDADKNLPIAPLILLPFVENVFKHGVSNNESSTIEIKIATKEKDILLYCKNTIFNAVKNNTRQGTGIANVKKRLENLYPGKHFLKTETTPPFFEVHLIINT